MSARLSWGLLVRADQSLDQPEVYHHKLKQLTGSLVPNVTCNLYGSGREAGLKSPHLCIQSLLKDTDSWYFYDWRWQTVPYTDDSLAEKKHCLSCNFSKYHNTSNLYGAGREAGYWQLVLLRRISWYSTTEGCKAELTWVGPSMIHGLSLIHIWRCRRRG